MTPELEDAIQPAPQLPSGPELDLATAVARLPQTNEAKFATRPIGGYDRAEVDAFLEGLWQSVDEVRAAAERDRRALVDLRAENARLQASMDASRNEEVTLGAVGLLSQAQMIADKAVADAEQYARELVLTAREEYRDALERAARASEAAATHAPTAPAAPAATPPTALPEIEYVRTYAHVAQIQLRSVLEALAEQVDRLGTLPHPVEGEPVPGAEQPPSTPALPDDEIIDEEPDWIPAIPPEPPVQRQTYIKP